MEYLTERTEDMHEHQHFLRNCLRHFYLKRPTCSSYIHNVHFCFFLFIYLFIPVSCTYYIFISVNTYFLFVHFFDFLFQDCKVL